MQYEDAKRYTYRVVNTYPHSAGSYTQGLYWHDGYLYEGTGNWGESRLMKVDLETGRAIQTIDLDRRVFGEGIALHKGKIYQITWTDGIAYVYDPETFELLGQRRYRGEGWGLASDGENLYMSNGSSTIFVVDPETFERKRAIPVLYNGNSLNYLNELEWIDGEIWANVYTTDAIVRIDPETGRVTGVIDLSGLLPESDRTSTTDVLNGIAYDEDNGRIFVTGKYWNKLFEIRLVELPR